MHLLTLQDLVKRFNARVLVAISELFEGIRASRNDPNGPIALSDQQRETFVSLIEGFIPGAESLGMKASAASCNRVLALLANTASTDGQLRALAIEFSGRLRDEIGLIQFLAIEPDHARLFQQPDLFGEEVSAAFPSAIVDVEEAGKCLALDRGTACVFHLMRVMEAGLRATAKGLGIPYAPSWESYLKQIDARVQAKYKRKGVKWRRDEPFYREVAAHLHAVRTAWRNPTMHIVREYTTEQAEEVFQSVRGFMRNLAEKLHE